MRSIARAAVIAAVSLPLVLASNSLASAAAASDVTYAFTVSGSTVINTITNNSGTALTCSTSVVSAPGGVLPPIAEVLGADQSMYGSGEIQPGVTAQSVTSIPDGSYVALATCIRSESDPAMWVADYPGLGEILKLYPNPAFAVQQASPIVTVPGATSPAIPGLPDFGSLSGR